MRQSPWQDRLQTLVLGRDQLRDLLQRRQMPRPVRIAKSMISDEVQPTFEQSLERSEFRIHVSFYVAHQAQATADHRYRFEHDLPLRFLTSALPPGPPQTCLVIFTLPSGGLVW